MIERALSVSRAMLASLSIVALCACATRQRPPLLLETDSARQAPAVQSAETRAPQAFAEAELYRRGAEEALAQGDRETTDIRSEQALAAYQRAVIEMRLAQASSKLSDEQAGLDRQRTDVAALEAEQQRLLAEVQALELRIKVVEDAQPVAASTPASPEREQARLKAARALAAEAKLLCASAQLLDPARSGPHGALDKLKALRPRLDAPPAPIDQAMELRTTCLRELTLTRRPANQKQPAAGAADALLTELAGADFAPFRDERGVVVTLRSSFDAGGALTAEARKAVLALAAAAKTHADFPLLLVVHGEATAAAPNRDAEQARVVADTLRNAGAPHVETELAGSALPVLPPGRAGARERNARIEVVFVSPTAS